MKGMTVAGTVRLTVVGRVNGPQRERAPIGAHGWAAVVRIDGHAVATLTRLPATVEWDTRPAGDGRHEVLVTIRNSGSDQEVVVEGATVTVDNATADAAAEAARAAAAQAAAGPDGTVTAPTAPPKPTLVLPEKAKVTRVSARIKASSNPLRARATALLRSGSRLYLGLDDGSIAFCTPDSRAKSGSVVRLPVWAGPVRSMAVWAGRVWWATEDGRTVYAFRAADRSVVRFDVTGSLVPPAPESPEASEAEYSAPAPSAATPTGWVRRIALLRGRVLLLGVGGKAGVLNPDSGTLTDPTTISGLLPSGDGAQNMQLCSLASDGGGATAPACVVTVSRAGEATNGGAATPTAVLAGEGAAQHVPPASRFSLRAWQVGTDGSWRPIGDLPTNKNPEQGLPLVVSPYGALATAGRDGVQLLLPGAADRELPFADSPNMPTGVGQLALGDSGLWWEARGIVFRADPHTGARDAFLPWNAGETGGVLALAADPDGVWVATRDKGVRRIRPGRPSPEDGYNGYVRARLGQQTMTPPTTRDLHIAWAIEAWQGTPYVWGGQSRSGTDCSGFVMRMHNVAGVSIPRTSAGMRGASKGRRVRADLQWGDTLVYPGHCALYIGNGRTAETVGGSNGGSVSKSSIWVRSNVVVRRFLR